MKTTIANLLNTCTPNQITDVDALASILRTFTSERNPDEKAAQLVQAFGSLKNTLEASPDALRNYTSKTTAEKLASLVPVSRLYQSRAMESPKQIANRKDLELFCKSLLQGKQIEEFWVVSVNAQCRILGAERVATGSIGEVSAYPRLVMQSALNHNAHSVFFYPQPPRRNVCPVH